MGINNSHLNNALIPHRMPVRLKRSWESLTCILLEFWQELCPGSLLPSTVLWQITLTSTGVLRMLKWYQTSEDAHVHSARPPHSYFLTRVQHHPSDLIDSLIP